MASCWQDATLLAEEHLVPGAGGHIVEVRSLETEEVIKAKEEVESDLEEDEDDCEESEDSEDCDEEEDSTSEDGSSSEDEDDDDEEEDSDKEDDDSEEEAGGSSTKTMEFAESCGSPPLEGAVSAFPYTVGEVVVARSSPKKCQDAFALASSGQDPSTAINCALKCIEKMAKCQDPCMKMNLLGQAMAQINGNSQATWLGDTMSSINDAKCKESKCKSKKERKKDKKRLKECKKKNKNKNKKKKKKKKKKNCCLVSI